MVTIEYHRIVICNNENVNVLLGGIHTYFSLIMSLLKNYCKLENF